MNINEKIYTLKTELRITRKTLCCTVKPRYSGAPSAHPDWIVPSVDEEVEMKFQRTI